MIWDPIERTLWGIVISLSLIASLLYAFKGKQKEDNKEKLILFGFTCYLFFNNFLIYFFRYMTDYQINGFFQNGVYFGDFSNYNMLFEFFYRCCGISGGIGFSLWYFTLERTVFRTKYILTITPIPFVIINLILPFNMFLVFSTYVFFLFTLISSFILLKLAIWSQLQFKIIVFFFFAAGLLNVWGLGFHHFSLKGLNIIPLFFAPLFIIGGVILFVIPLLVDSSRIPQNVAYFYALIFATILLWFIVALINLINNNYVYFFTGIPFLILSIIMQYYIVKNIKAHYSGLISSEHGNEKLVFLGIFSRPQKVTEEEVSVSKEKKICIVCKGKVGRNNIYLCPNCDTFYCSKCSNTLITLENACWVCNAPFDPLKPVKIYKEEQDDFNAEKIFENGKEK